jgi:hypothetical protein
LVLSCVFESIIFVTGVEYDVKRQSHVYGSCVKTEVLIPSD